MNNFKRNIVVDILLTLVLCGLWNIVIQNTHIQALNEIKKEPGRYSLLRLVLLSLLTCGLYIIYFEYRKAKDIAEITGTDETGECVLAIVLSVLCLSWVYDAIFQSKLNQWIEQSAQKS